MSHIIGFHRSNEDDNSSHWLSVSDLMAGLMMVFLFIAIALMREAFIERDKIKEIAVAYQENQVALYESLNDEFEKDLKVWDAEIDRATLSLNFKSPDVLFDVGEITIKPRFQEILDDFFPRYLQILLSFKDSINEVRIEGHTDSSWNHETTTTEAYFRNMWLSQGRTRSVLRYVYELPTYETTQEWVKEHIAAVGFSSSRVILNTAGTEDKMQSRRVSFRVITNAEIQIKKILSE